MSSSMGTVRFAEINTNGRTSRTRKPHIKTRTGCENCKKRKVKCDQKSPCRGCVKRNQDCSLTAVRNQQQQYSPTVTNNKPLSNQKSLHTVPTSINMLHMKFFHHFEHVLVDTLVFDSYIWKDYVLPLALEVLISYT
jgi:hypothetical protein